MSWYPKGPSDLVPEQPSYNLKNHLAYVQDLWRGYKYNSYEKCKPAALQLLKGCPEHLRDEVAGFLGDLLEQNEIFIVDEPSIEHAGYLKRMQARLTADPDRAFPAIHEFLNHFYENLPSQGGSLSLPFSQTVRAHEFIGFIIHCFYSVKDGDVHLFEDLHRQIDRNLIEASGYDYLTFDGKKKLTGPEEYKGTQEEVYAKYLKDTPFLSLLDIQLSFSIPRSKYAEHTAVFAPTGWGKTRLIEHTVISLLREPDPPPMFIIDSMGAMLKKIEKLQLIPSEKLVILDPTDEVPPALNFFKIQGGSEAQQQELFFYLFKALDSSFTRPQATMVHYLVQLMGAIKGANLDTLREVCESTAKDFAFREQLSTLPPRTQDYFEKQFLSKDGLIGQRKQQIAGRLYTLATNDNFMRMFNSTENKFSAGEVIRKKQVCLVNTDRLNLGDDASSIFGRFIIAQVLAAAFARAPIPEKDRHLALLFVDEVKAYADEQIKTFLADARQFGVGIFMATQAPHQLAEGVQDEIAANAAIRMSGNFDDNTIADGVASSMRSSRQQLQSLEKRDFDYTEFATYIRGLTPHALTLKIPMTTLRDEPVVTNDEHRARRARNRERYGTHEAPTKAEASHGDVALPARADTPSIHEKVKPETNQKQQQKTETDITKPSPQEYDTDH